NFMKKLLLLPILFAAIVANAQISIGIKGGVNVSNFTGNNFDTIKANSLVAFHIGAFLRFKFGRHLVLHPELLFSSQGAKLDDKGQSDRNDLHQFRPSLVTATGIFLGFMLNFTDEWLPHSFSRSTAGGIIVAVSVTSSIGLLIVVLYRILKKNYPVDNVDTFY